MEFKRQWGFWIPAYAGMTTKKGRGNDWLWAAARFV